MEENRGNENNPEAAPQKAKGGMIKEVIVYVVAMFVMTIIAVVMVTVLFKGETEGNTLTPESSESVEASVDTDSSPSKNDPVYTFDPPIIVNTSDPEATRILSVKIHVVFRKSSVKVELENSEVLQYQMRDLFITTFSAKTAYELQNTDVKKELKEYLKKEINNRLGEDVVKQVYFSEYIIQ